MELTPEERQLLHHGLMQAFTTSGDLEVLVALGLGKPLSHITPDDTHQAQVMRIILYAEARDVIRPLIEAARRQNDTNETLRVYGQQILDRLAEEEKRVWYRPPNHYQTCFVQGPGAFIDRDPLRRFLENLTAPNGSNILVVNGPSESGKTYSVQLVTYLRDALGLYELAWSDLRDEIAAEFQPEDLVRSISLQVGWEIEEIPPPMPTSPRYAKVLCDWIQRQINAGNKPLVIVLDGFHEPSLNARTRELVQEMIRRTSMNLVRMRLVLLNYTPALIPPKLPVPVGQDETRHLDREDVAQFFRLFFIQRGQPPDEAVIRSIVEEVMGALPADSDCPNRTLNSLITAAAQKLQQAPSPVGGGTR